MTLEPERLTMEVSARRISRFFLNRYPQETVRCTTILFSLRRPIFILQTKIIHLRTSFTYRQARLTNLLHHPSLISSSKDTQIIIHTYKNNKFLNNYLRFNQFFLKDLSLNLPAKPFWTRASVPSQWTEDNRWDRRSCRADVNGSMNLFLVSSRDNWW